MKDYRPRSWPAALLTMVCLAGSIFSLRSVDKIRGQQATLEDTLYIHSGKTLKRLSLGYSGLLADIYWTRAVQYFGTKHIEKSSRYDLLYPLLDITTDLDPHLTIAYQFGSIFLSQPAPSGAGQPDQAVQLVEKGIRANPEKWRLYFTLGYIHYFDRKDYKAAQLAFQKGSEVPGALPWMKVMAAAMAQHAGESGTAVEIWRRIYESTDDDGIRQNAVQHLVALQVDADVTELQRRVDLYRQKMNRLPAGWQDLIQAGLLKRIPRGPDNSPYVLTPGGTVQVQDAKSFPFITKGLP
jgi:hypothetical protein